MAELDELNIPKATRPVRDLLFKKGPESSDKPSDNWTAADCSSLDGLSPEDRDQVVADLARQVADVR